jgi:uncharacterized delta-60 repeat protein
MSKSGVHWRYLLFDRLRAGCEGENDVHRISWLYAAICACLAGVAHAGSLGPLTDPHFGTSGFASIDHGGGPDRTDYGNAVALQGSRLLIAASASTPGNTTWPTFGLPALLRLNADGSRDAGFGSNGWVLTPSPGANGNLVDVAVTGEGKIVAFGWYNNNPGDQSRHVLFTRLSANGVPDTSFGPNGLRLLSLGDNNSPARMTMQADGKVLGLVNYTIGTARACIGVVRLNTDGTTDTAFRSGGNECLTSDNPTTPIAVGQAIQVQADGKILIAGYANHLSTNNGDMLAVRLLASGEPDTGFGTGGFTWIAYDQGGSLFDAANAIAVDSAGRIVLAGSFENIYSTDMGIVRLLPNGQLDTGFGLTGRASVNFGDDHSTLNRTAAYANGVAILPGDRILLAGTTGIAGPSSFDSPGAAIELEADGSLEARFGDASIWSVLAPDYANDDRERVGFNDMAVVEDRAYLIGNVDTYNLAVSTEMDPDVAAVKLILPIFRDSFDAH